MSASSTPEPRLVRKRRPVKHEPKGLKAVPLALWASLAVCLAVVTTVFVFGQQAWKSKSSPDAAVVAGSHASTVKAVRQLSISGAKVAADCDCIRGKVYNSSSTLLKEVQIYYHILGPKDSDMGTVLAFAGIVKPRTEASFATDALPKNFARWVLAEIKAAE